MFGICLTDPMIMTVPNDTIAAIATPTGVGGVGVLRISGPLVTEISAKIAKLVPQPRFAQTARFFDCNNEQIDHGLVLYFQTPRSFTGEDVLELHSHGSPVVLDLLLETVLTYGARLARPGEFSERAFLNDKIDLAQAEAIADLIAAQSRHAAKAAMRTLDGVFSREVNAIVEKLIHLRMFVESALDFPDEDIEFISKGKILDQITQAVAAIASLLARATTNQRMQEGLRVVIAGLPNAGKSSLLNALAERECAIVTSVPGTTRDIVRESILIDGIPIHVLDTAGLRESVDPVETIGIERAQAAITQADMILLVLDDSGDVAQQRDRLSPHLPNDVPVIQIFNKIDLSGRKPDSTVDSVFISAKTSQGIDELRKRIKRVAGFADGFASDFSARRRHLDALRQAQTAAKQAAARLGEGSTLDLSAEDLRTAQQALNVITGEFSNEDLLTRVFSTFCIGK